jgi:hypothetical protein
MVSNKPPYGLTPHAKKSDSRSSLGTLLFQSCYLYSTAQILSFALKTCPNRLSVMAPSNTTSTIDSSHHIGGNLYLPDPEMRTNEKD